MWVSCWFFIPYYRFFKAACTHGRTGLDDAGKLFTPYSACIVPFWVVYAFLVYQLVSFHDYNACLLEECSTSAVYSYITLICTLIFWFTTSDKSTVYGFKAEPKPKEPKKPNIEIKEPSIEPLVKQDIFNIED